MNSRSGTRALDRPVVIAAAIRLLDEVGLDGLTLRRLAKELGVAAPALYWHFRDKQELLDHMVVALAGDIYQWEAPAPGQHWDGWLVERARAQRKAMLAHRDSARLAAGTRPTAALIPRIEKNIEALTRAGLTPGQALRSVLVLGNYVAGFVLDEQAEVAREAAEGDQGVAAAEQEFRDRMSTGKLPNLAVAFEEVGDPNDEAGFEYGLGLILDGLRAQVARNAARA
jgi:TetR/AcrR family transcriptional regulator, tetracycline repressor protein